MAEKTDNTITRRRVIGTAALAATTAIAAPYVRGAYAAGKLNLAFWDHWVPGANNTLTKLCQEYKQNPYPSNTQFGWLWVDDRGREPTAPIGEA